MRILFWHGGACDVDIDLTDFHRMTTCQPQEATDGEQKPSKSPCGKTIRSLAIFH
jgi:hypothetical protein